MKCDNCRASWETNNDYYGWYRELKAENKALKEQLEKAEAEARLKELKGEKQ